MTFVNSTDECDFPRESGWSENGGDGCAQPGHLINIDVLKVSAEPGGACIVIKSLHYCVEPGDVCIIIKLLSNHYIIVPNQVMLGERAVLECRYSFFDHDDDNDDDHDDYDGNDDDNDIDYDDYDGDDDDYDGNDDDYDDDHDDYFDDD